MEQLRGSVHNLCRNGDPGGVEIAYGPVGKDRAREVGVHLLDRAVEAREHVPHVRDAVVVRAERKAAIGLARDGARMHRYRGPRFALEPVPVGVERVHLVLDLAYDLVVGCRFFCRVLLVDVLVPVMVVEIIIMGDPILIADQELGIVGPRHVLPRVVDDARQADGHLCKGLEVVDLLVLVGVDHLGCGRREPVDDLLRDREEHRAGDQVVDVALEHEFHVVELVLAPVKDAQVRPHEPAGYLRGFGPDPSLGDVRDREQRVELGQEPDRHGRLGRVVQVRAHEARREGVARVGRGTARPRPGQRDLRTGGEEHERVLERLDLLDRDGTGQDHIEPGLDGSPRNGDAEATNEIDAREGEDSPHAVGEPDESIDPSNLERRDDQLDLPCDPAPEADEDRQGDSPSNESPEMLTDLSQPMPPPDIDEDGLDKIEPGPWTLDNGRIRWRGYAGDGDVDKSWGEDDIDVSGTSSENKTREDQGESGIDVSGTKDISEIRDYQEESDIDFSGADNIGESRDGQEEDDINFSGIDEMDPDGEREPEDADPVNIDESQAEGLPHAVSTDQEQEHERDVDALETSGVEDEGPHDADQLPRPDLPEEIFLLPVMRANIDDYMARAAVEGVDLDQAENLPHAAYPNEDVPDIQASTAEKTARIETSVPEEPEQGEPVYEPDSRGIEGSRNDLDVETDAHRALNEPVVDDIIKQVANDIDFKTSEVVDGDLGQEHGSPTEPDYPGKTNDEIVDDIIDKVGREIKFQPSGNNASIEGEGFDDDDTKPDYSGKTNDEIADTISERVKENIAKSHEESPLVLEPEAGDGRDEPEPLSRDRDVQDREPVGNQEAEIERLRPEPMERDDDEWTAKFEAEDQAEAAARGAGHQEGEAGASEGSGTGTAGSTEEKPVDSGCNDGCDENMAHGGRSRDPGQDGGDDRPRNESGSDGEEGRRDKRTDEPEPDMKAPDDDQGEREINDRGEERRDTRDEHHDRDEERTSRDDEGRAEEARQEEDVRDEVEKERPRDAEPDGGAKKIERYSGDGSARGEVTPNDEVDEPDVVDAEGVVGSEEDEHDAVSDEGVGNAEHGEGDEETGPAEAQVDREEARNDEDDEKGNDPESDDSWLQRKVSPTGTITWRGKVKTVGKQYAGKPVDAFEDATHSDKNYIEIRDKNDVKVDRSVDDNGIGDSKAAMLKRIVAEWPFRNIKDTKPEEYPPDHEIVFKTKAGNHVVWKGTKKALKERLEKQDTRAMADQLGINPATIIRQCAEVGLQLEKGSTSGFNPPSKEALEAVLDRAGSAAKLAKAAGVSGQTVQRACEKWGIDLQARAATPGNKWQPTKEFLEKEIFVKGKPLVKIAREAGVDERTVYRRLEQHGIDVRKGAIDRIDKETFARDMRENDNLAEVAAKHHMTRETAKSVAARLGIPETEWAFMNKPESLLRQMPDKLLQQHLETKTLKQIGDMVGRSEAAVHYELNRRGLKNPRAKAFLPAREDERSVASNGSICWAGIQVAVGRKYQGKVVYIQPHPNGQDLDIFSDINHKKIITSTRIPFSDRNPVLRVDSLNNETRKRLLEMPSEKIQEMYNDRLNGMTTSAMAIKYGLQYDEMEKLLIENRVSPNELTIDHVKDYIDHYHPGAKVTSPRVIDSKQHVDITCENGHETKISPNSIFSGAWCGKCHEEQNFAGETKCREIFEELFSKPFAKDRPEWLIGPKGRPLELDGYNEGLKIAFEYNGIQHYQYHEFFHKGDPREFQKEQEYDALKDKECKDHGVVLVWIPYWIDEHDRKQFIIDELIGRGIKMPVLRSLKINRIGD